MPDVRINLNEEENRIAIEMSTRLGMSKRNYVKREFRHSLIRKGLVKQSPVDLETGLTK